jgi:protein-tyrosine-phosphatase
VASLINIHFVCTGNIYRSRMAEAYCNSKGISGLRVTSSGIAAGRDGDAAISPWAAGILERFGLKSYAAANWQKTTEALIQGNEVLVFMESEHQQFCGAWVDPGRHRVEVWEIEDIGPMDIGRIPEKVERTFAMIRERTDALLRTLEFDVR